MNFMFKNGKDKPSKTATVYIITMVIIWVKFLLEGLSLAWGDGNTMTFAPLDPALIAALVSASGAVYAWRRGQEVKERQSEQILDVDAELKKLADS